MSTQVDRRPCVAAFQWQNFSVELLATFKGVANGVHKK